MKLEEALPLMRQGREVEARFENVIGVERLRMVYGRAIQYFKSGQWWYSDMSASTLVNADFTLIPEPPPLPRRFRGKTFDGVAVSGCGVEGRSFLFVCYPESHAGQRHVTTVEDLQWED